MYDIDKIMLYFYFSVVIKFLELDLLQFCIYILNKKKLNLFLIDKKLKFFNDKF